MTWKMDRVLREYDAHHGFANMELRLWNGEKTSPRRFIGCHFWFRPGLKFVPTNEQLFRVLFPDAPDYTERRLTDYLVLLTRIRGGNACDFVSSDGLKTLTYTMLNAEPPISLKDALEAYEAGVEIDDILA